MKIVLALFVLMIIAGILEYRLHRRNLEKIPCVIHVNGTRGKSSTTRLIHGGLTAAGYKTIAKTTGTEPRIIYEDGSEKEIFRAGIPRITEQVSLVNSIKNREIDVLVVECMAISPEMQWISENRLLNSHIGVITNVRYDHQDKMGESLDEIASTLALTIPKDGDFITADRRFFDKFKAAAEKRGSRIVLADFSGMEKINLRDYFKSPVFRENVSCALAVCRLFEIDDKIALRGMAGGNPDPGALNFFRLTLDKHNLYFINAFAANDFESTITTWEIWQSWYGYENYQNLPLVGIFNSRLDRGYRVKEFMELSKILDFTELYIMGYSPVYLLKSFASPRADSTRGKFSKLKVSRNEGSKDRLTSSRLTSYGFSQKTFSRANFRGIFKHLKNLSHDLQSDLLLFGFGNTKNAGLKLIEYFQENGEEI